MNAKVLGAPSEPAPTTLTIPEAALGRLRLRLGRDAANGEALDASLSHGVPYATLSALVEYWVHDFELQAHPAWALPSFTTEVHGLSWSFLHVRSRRADAVPLLLLHGYSGSVAEMAGLMPSLVDPDAHGVDASDAFHTVCPALPGFGLSHGTPDARTIAEGCAALMRELGYARYVVHGSDLGANLALALAELDREHVAGVHVTALPAYPAAIPEEMANLTATEKSQLALATDVRNELFFGLPDTPIQELAFALGRLEHPEVASMPSLRDALLAGLTLSWALGDATARQELYRQTRLASAGVSGRPLAVDSFPLDVPSLRRFAEKRHRVVKWTEHEHGGPMPALEQPELLLQLLRGFFRRFR